MKTVFFDAIGRRKEAVARVRLVPGEGKVTVNKVPLLDFFKRETTKLEEAVESAIERVLREHANATTEEIAALGTIRQLRTQRDKLTDDIAELKLKQSQAEREIEHKLGLARLRQTAESDIAEAKLEAREKQMEALQEVAVGEAKIAAKEEAMKRADELLGEQVERMERLVDTLVEALPTASLVAEVSGARD